jgi:hypothetical protein
MYGYLTHFKHVNIQLHEHEYSSNPEQECTWMFSIYGDMEEQVPHNAPTPLRKKKEATVETVTYGSELVVSQTCVEGDIVLCILPRYLGVQIYTRAYMIVQSTELFTASAIISSNELRHDLWHPQR